MRYAHRIARLGDNSNILPMPLRSSNRRERDELAAFRGFFLAVCASILFWSLCLAALWLVRWRN